MTNKWFRCFRPLAAPQIRLLCFPPAGGGAGLFHRWPGRLAPSGIEVWAVQLPGREIRIREAPPDKIAGVIHQLLVHFPMDRQRPFIFFGHSMGALLAFELARAMRRNSQKEPHLLVIAAAAAPHFPPPEPHLHTLPRPEFLAALETRYSGIPAAVAGHAELLDLVLPMLRADIRLYETYTYRPESPLPMPIITFGGLDDTAVSRRELAAWRQHTADYFELHLLPGGHFFVQEKEEMLLTLLTERLALNQALYTSP